MRARSLSSKYYAQYKKFFRDFPDFSVVRTQHALDRMKTHGVQLPQIRTVLRTGSVLLVESDIRTGLDKYRVSGHDADGRALEVVANLDETNPGRVVIITIIDPLSTGDSDRHWRTKRGDQRSSEGEREDRASEVEGCSASGPP